MGICRTGWPRRENKRKRKNRILADLKNACLMISKSSSLKIRLLGIFQSTLIITGITVTFVSLLFQFFDKVDVFVSVFAFFKYLLFFYCFSFLLTINSSGRLAGIVWSVCILKLPEYSVLLIVQERFSFAKIALGRMIKFQSLDQFPVDKSSYSVSSSLVLVLHLFTAFSYLSNPPLGQDMTQGQFLSGV